MNNQIKIALQAKEENIENAKNFATCFLLLLDLDNDYISEVRSCVNEAISNAIIHGYNSDDSKYVTMNLYYDENDVYIEVLDSGVGIEDVEKAREPLYTTKVDEERAGLGFTIMEVFTDKLEVRSRVNNGTTISMIKEYNRKGDYYE